MPPVQVSRKKQMQLLTKENESLFYQQNYDENYRDNYLLMSPTFTQCANNFTNVTRLQEIDTFDLPKCQQGEIKVLLSTFSRKKVALSRE